MKLDRQKYLESRSVKPSYILIALLAVNIVLGAIAFVFPEEGLKLSKNLNLKFLNKYDLLENPESSDLSVNVDDVLAGVNPLEEDSVQQPIDTAYLDLMANIDEQLRSASDFDSLTGQWRFPQQRSIQFSKEHSSALNYFFESLLTEAKTEVIRILHYGDSQLEGDRITDYFRNRMQLLFGGRGPGIILPKEPTAGARRSAYVRCSPNIKKHAIYKKGSKVDGNFYGIGGASFEIQGFYNKPVGFDTAYVDTFNVVDSIQVLDTVITPLYETVSKSTAYVQVSNSKSSYLNVKSYDQVRLFYFAEEPFTMEVSLDTNYIRQTIPAATSLGFVSWNQEVNSRVRFNVVQGKFPLLYGIALDGTAGVAVDNFPMRGSAALGFSSMNRNVYARQLNELGVKLIILQYGVNVIPSVLSDYTYYERMLTKELEAIKLAHPDVSILVIGPSDMSRNKGGRYVSYSNIPLVRDAMRNAAFKSGCAFWDLYEAMGGENSMAAWVEEGYAGKDYTHFSSKGAKFVGEMLFNAIMNELRNYETLNSEG
ncbi:MAG: hypothetical protein JXR19_05260 [Bacteroidia bacterium]